MQPKSKLKILMLSEYYVPFDRGGSEWSTHFLASELIRRGAIVSIFTPNFGSKIFERIDNVPVYRFPSGIHLTHSTRVLTPFYFSNPLWLIRSTFYLWLQLKKHPATHLHVQGKYLLPTAFIVGKLFQIPVIITLRDYIPLCPYGYCLTRVNQFHACNFRRVIFSDLQLLRKNKLQKYYPLISELMACYGWFIALVLRFFIKHSNQVVGISQALSNIYIKNNLVVHKTIYNSYTDAKVTPVLRKNYIIFAGRFTRGKGFDLLLSAYSKLEIESKPRLVLLGDGPLINLYRECKDTRVEWKGHTTYKKVQTYIRSALFTIIPSVWEEPFGRVALESILQGVPVLVTSRGGLPEIVKISGGGLIIEPDLDSLQMGITHLLKNHKKYRKILTERRQILHQKFCTEPAFKYERLYLSLL
ncbi:TPA: hypothetical protein DIV55_05280 [Patescibacteria group bacterium]|uniref:Glycosyl transferase, group 1 family protein n=1 Tax=Candidatus Gottesmanbacteria bacterium GW2011_GWA1_43_11 TaxID=1618436 RepID=A0A0G1FHM0_9BACT|nr:MAG: Glycosyl transferase, group 1 family protein [Candidatus Gottesmanbacteria bacterium GW2011_GWA1_43_11]HCS79122.1 hypothetical protein [Patescibacteria group bacterium]